MKAIQFRFPVMSVFVLLFLCTNYLIADASLDDLSSERSSKDEVVWSGASAPSSMMSSVDGKRLLIDGSVGDIVLDPGPTRVFADKSDIEVTLQGNPTVRCNKHGDSQLILESNPERKITFNLKYDDLSFKGSRGKKQRPLLMLISPGSTVDFIINGGQELSFKSDRESGGTAVFVGLLDYDGTRLSFIRRQGYKRANEDARVTIGRRSSISFAGEGTNDPDKLGTVRFDPTNEIGNAGRMVLYIAPTGGFIIRPHAISDILNPIFKHIDTTVLSNGFGRVEVVNSGSDSQASLQVINANNRIFDLLADPFLTLDVRNDITDYNGLFSGVQYGFVLGANGVLDIDDNAYLDYVGLANNVCPLTSCFTVTSNCCPVECCVTNTACPEIACFEGFDPESLLKPRNPSAFFVDGSFDPCAMPAQIRLGEHSAIFFRSGVDCRGQVIHKREPFQFTINPAFKTPGAGEIVFDVEGPLHVRGSNGDCSLLSKLEILSLEVMSSGGPLFYNTDEVIFPKLTCNMVDCCFFRSYNKASFLINNRLELFNTVLVHSDQNHRVVKNDDVNSEATYMGGEIAHLLENCVARPKIVFYNSRLFVHTDVAFTGLDLLVPNLSVPDNDVLRKHSACAPCDDDCEEFGCDFCNDDCDVAEAFPLTCLDNISEFRFFYNGNKLDNGIGRQMILGTRIGSLACNDCRVISADVHLDIVPESCCNGTGSEVEQLLLLTTDANNNVVNCELTANEDITDQFAEQTIFLGNASTIQVGEQVNNQANCF
jgi:hypothetical protein